ncbi:uncharacterized protein K452DRAFT_312707 [Aplosporella prunicola CBS 121167]|uniref:Uncharacterized protein n=1 Tax=Aplosporella prunicola CBS 121167 TaxID=1176127 RepID=A0A6A6B2R0_9PEZI|nr:uncharacterized protein K452DRAFT_312707 [Aplosporella prunicola CBS 121167]KAF2137011.1 hypothetical protein K452DRAFT_312707 [Aplosporella prunicola CBS 121167]
MQSLVCLSLFFAQAAYGSLDQRQVRLPSCQDEDNCGFAVTGTSRPAVFQTLAREDCSSYMTDTTTFGHVTETTVSTTTVTLLYNGTTTLAKRATTAPEPTGKSVPWYAWPCDIERYAEVCSCFGYPAATATVSAAH